MANPALRRALAEKRFIVAPGVYDLISAKIADRMGFACLYGTGFGVVASAFGLPDAGLATYTEMVSRMAAIAAGVTTPLIADGDTGYGGLLNVRRTVEGYERAGISGIQLEDQEMPKKCGHTPGRRVVAAEEMVLKIRVAIEARRSEDFLIVARTDARTALGLDEAIRRGRLYAEAGADVIFVESPESEEELSAIARAIDAPLLVNMVEGGRTPILPAERLKELGFAIAIYPALGFLTAAAALERAYAHLHAVGDSRALGEPYGFARMTELMGFSEVWDFEARWADAARRLGIG
ncbi:MAG: isocitrate lyase/PEP mutase family protein [Elioraea sp.]|nr:isocitrate lyase/PEP mutase family protein [Elioraea sp.]MDW8445373.1 isocitrate lyase/PEP mutase family protein [Acetobacteraceae bacterium]